MKMALFSHFSRIYKSQVYDPELIFFPSFFFLSPFSSLSLSRHPLSVSLSFCSLVFVSHWSIWVLWASCIYLYIIFAKKGLFLTIMSSNIFPPFSPSSYSWTFTSDRSVHSYILLKLCSLILKIISERFIWISSGFFSPMWIILGIWIILSLMLNFFSPKLFIYRQLFFFRCLI